MPTAPSFVPSLPTRASRTPSLRRSTAPCMCVPDAGLIAKAGVTGTTCANLYPIPILGAYGWFLNVYRRDVAERVGAFRLHIAHPSALALSFAPDVVASPQRHLSGVATSKYSVADALRSLPPSTPHDVLLYEDAQSFWNSRYEVRGCAETQVAPALLSDSAPTYVVRQSAGALQVREMFRGEESKRDTPRLQYFAMNLSPIPIFREYCCVVCVWRQGESTSALAIDKRGKEVHLGFVDARETEGGVESIGMLAVHQFFGAVTDAVAYGEHARLLQAVDEMRGFEAVSRADYRIVVCNAPRTVTKKRKCEIMVQVRRVHGSDR